MFQECCHPNSGSTKYQGLGLSDKLLKFILLIAIICASNAQAMSRDVSTLPIFQGEGAKSDYYRTILDPNFKKCGSVSCQALRDIGKIFELVLDRTFPNSMARLDPVPKNWNTIYSHKIDKIVWADQRRWPFYCKISQEIARSIESWDDWKREMTNTIIEIVQRSSQNSQCITEMINLLPYSEDMKDSIRYSKEMCIDDHRARCSEIRRK